MIGVAECHGPAPDPKSAIVRKQFKEARVTKTHRHPQEQRRRITLR